jgi:hypothetical protein
MTAMGVHCIQPASPTIVKNEEDSVDVLLVQQIRTEKTAWKHCQIVQQPIYKDTANNNCKEQLYYKKFHRRPKLWQEQTWMLHQDNAPSHTSVLTQ